MANIPPIHTGYVDPMAAPVELTPAGTKPTLHSSTFEYLKPTDLQLDAMQDLREASAAYAGVLENIIPAGPDKTYLLRKFREVAMWANIAVTRHPDGTPRS